MEAHIRKATPDDAKAVAGVLNSVIHEGQYTVFTRPFTEEEERSFISSLGERSAILVAEVNHQIVGIQAIDLLVTVQPIQSELYEFRFGIKVFHHQ